MVESAAVGVEKDPGFFAALRKTQKSSSQYSAGCRQPEAQYANLSMQGEETESGRSLEGFGFAGFFLFAEFHPADFAADCFGELVDEFYFARVLVGGGYALAVFL